MGKGNEMTTEMEKAFLALSPEERGAVISHGVALRLSHLRKRLFLAESKIRHFEDQYKVTLDQLEGHGLANDADFEMHEDYVMWSHWVEVADKAKKDIIEMEKIARQGLHLGESEHVGS